MAKKSLYCWKCGATLEGMTMPLSRRDECPICTVELHTCRMCRHYDVNLDIKCRSDYADPPRVKERANFCDYFAASANAYRPESSRKSDAARDQLAALFGEAPAEKKAETERAAKVRLTEEEKARIELDKLFGG